MQLKVNRITDFDDLLFSCIRIRISFYTYILFNIEELQFFLLTNFLIQEDSTKI